jgi:hypothetical protein
MRPGEDHASGIGLQPAPWQELFRVTGAFSCAVGSASIPRQQTSMKWKQPLYWFLLVASASGCASPKVGYDYDHSANFSAYHTYEWMSGKQEATGDRRLDNSLVDARIRTAIGAQLRSKGYTSPVNGSPDFYVAYHVGVKDMMKGSSTQNYIGDRVHGTYTTISDIQPYKEGTLLVDIVDAASKQLVWQASALAEIDPGMTPEERDERISGIVHAMLSQFPPQ